MIQDIRPLSHKVNNPTSHTSPQLGLQGITSELRSLQPDASAAMPYLSREYSRGKDDKVPHKGSQLSTSALPGSKSDEVLGDWESLLRSVTAQFQLSARNDMANLTGKQPSAQAGLDSLEELHRTMVHELGRLQLQQLEIFDLQTSLAQARAELAGSQNRAQLVRYQTLHDNVASLPNLDLFRERIDYALKLATPQRRAFAILYFNLEGFHAIQETHGPDASDELLQIVASRLTRAVRAEDMVCRLEGDEFACLLADLPSRVQLSHLACKLSDAVSAPIKIGQLRLTLRPSIGVAICPADGTDSSVLIAHASLAMRRARQHQIGYAFFDECADV